VLVSIAIETAGSPHIDRESLNLLVRPVTASNGWRADDLSTIDGSGEVDITTRRSDGTTAARYRGVQTCHEGKLSAGRPCASNPPEPLTPDHLNDEKGTTWTRTPAPPR